MTVALLAAMVAFTADDAPTRFERVPFPAKPGELLYCCGKTAGSPVL